MIKLLVTNDVKTALTEPMQANDIGFLAVPTTAGTGSEATRYSIFYVNENEKHSVTHEDFCRILLFWMRNFKDSSSVSAQMHLYGCFVPCNRKLLECEK